ncbi:MAG: bifunctional 3-(3-hydroxy-phenyl)propionate/3-hydroxycinnamic acid hydroxylase [Ilumatobacteraceae bacterium]
MRHDVAIVGMGPTGATLANLCGRAGLRTVVHERDPAPYSQPRACHLDAEIARVFAQLGFEQQLHDVLTVSAGMEYVDAQGERLFTFEGFEREPLLGWHEDYVFVQPQVEAMLRSGLDRFPHVEVHLGVEAPPIDTLLADARWVIACDGATSPTRDALGIRMRDLEYHQPWLVVDVTLHDTAVPPLPSIIQQVCDPARLATFVPSHAEYRRWEFLLHGDEHPDPWDLLAPWGVTAENSTLVRAARYRFHALVAERWRGGPDGRVLLAGDAAHLMPPFMGQGMCSGIRDAVNLSWKLREVLDTGDESLLDTYEAERAPHAETVVRMSMEAGRTLSRLAADPTDLPTPDAPDPVRWSRLPGIELGEEFPVGHLLPQPDRLDDRLPDGWVWVAADQWFDAPDGRMVVVEPRATYGCRAVLVRPDRYIATAIRRT